MLGAPSLLLGNGPLTPKPLAGLPSAATLPTGTQYEITDYGGNIAIVINGAWRFVAPFRTTWSGRPAVGLVPAGTELQVTDYANQKFISDGTYWRPAQGRVTIGQQWGDYATPLAVLSSTTAAQFAIPGGSPKIPSGMITPHSSVQVRTTMKKIGANATTSQQCRIGTTGGNGDALFAAVTPSSSATGLDVQLAASARFRTSQTRLCALQYAGEGQSTGTVGPGNDFTANVNTAADMYVSFFVAAGNVSDTYNLIGYNIWLEA